MFLEGEAGVAAESGDVAYNPWPYYTFTGKLRPWKQTPIRTVPSHIGRPDYADHPTGKPISEESFRGMFRNDERPHRLTLIWIKFPQEIQPLKY